MRELSLQDVRALELPPLAGFERALLQHSALGRVLIGLVSHGVAALPFGEPIAAALAAVFGCAVQVRGEGEGGGRGVCVAGTLAGCKGRSYLQLPDEA
jgi:hypothetical protein